jgi:site-specific recombinase XerD
MRNRAIFAALAATGIRHDALISLKIKHVNLQLQAIIQEPLEVNTKRGKLINSKLLNVCDGAPEIVMSWVKYLKADLFFSDKDPIFPKEMLVHDEFSQFKATRKLTKEHV